MTGIEKEDNKTYETQEKTNQCSTSVRPATLTEDVTNTFNYFFEEMSRFKRKIEFLKAHPIFEKLYEEYNKL